MTCATCRRYKDGKCGLDDGYIQKDAKCGQWAGWAELVQEQAAEIGKLTSQLDVAAQEYAEAEKEIDRMKCCGNCGKGERNNKTMFIGCESIHEGKPFGFYAVPWSKCDRWEAAK